MPRKKKMASKSRTAKSCTYSNLNATALGLSIGLIISLSMLVVSVLNVSTGWGGNTLYLVSEWYLGYDLTFGGMVLGMIWGFFDGFIGGFLIGWLYNAFSHVLCDH